MGFSLPVEPNVPKLFSDVARTKGYGNWKHWFVAENVAYFLPIIAPFLGRYAYGSDWELDLNPKILPERSTGNLEHVVRRRKIIQRRSGINS